MSKAHSDTNPDTICRNVISKLEETGVDCLIDTIANLPTPIDQLEAA